MADECEDCKQVKMLGFQIDSLEILHQRTKLDIEGVRQMQEARDIEHETMIQGLTTRMDDMAQELNSFKKDMNGKFDKMDESVTKRLDSMEISIPKLFEQSMNALLARIAKWLLISIGIVLVVVLLAVTRPILVNALKELENKIENVDVVK